MQPVKKCLYRAMSIVVLVTWALPGAIAQVVPTYAASVRIFSFFPRIVSLGFRPAMIVCLTNILPL